MVDVDPERFEEMVSEALEGIPAELGELMGNVAVTVQLDNGPAGLVGLYQGVPGVRTQMVSRPATSVGEAVPYLLGLHTVDGAGEQGSRELAG
ncbi:MAG: hypothetical protein ABIQ53_04790 [Terracoccus sp.]